MPLAVRQRGAPPDVRAAAVSLVLARAGAGLVRARQVAAVVVDSVASWVDENSMKLRGDSDDEFYQAPAPPGVQGTGSTTGFKRRNCFRSRNISRRIVRITEADASVLSPRVRGK